MRENDIFLSTNYAEDNMVAKAWVSSRVTSAKTRCQSKSIGARYHPLPKTFQKNTYLSSDKQGIIIELTVPAEENLAQANHRKKIKYEDLIQEGQAAGWELKYFPV